MKEARIFRVDVKRDGFAEASRRWVSHGSTEDAAESWECWGATLPLLVDQLATVYELNGYAAGLLVRLAAGEGTEAAFLARELLPVSGGAA